MTSDSFTELGNIRERFHNWKQNNPYQHIPKELWDDALTLIDKYSLGEVAESIGYAPAYVRLKQRNRQALIPSPVQFVEMPRQTTFEHNQTQVIIRNQQGVSVELAFQGAFEQVFPLITSLFKDGYSCCK